MEFCEWTIGEMDKDSSFSGGILFTDEAKLMSMEKFTDKTSDTAVTSIRAGWMHRKCKVHGGWWCGVKFGIPDWLYLFLIRQFECWKIFETACGRCHAGPTTSGPVDRMQTSPDLTPLEDNGVSRQVKRSEAHGKPNSWGMCEHFPWHSYLSSR